MRRVLLGSMVAFGCLAAGGACAQALFAGPEARGSTRLRAVETAPVEAGSPAQYGGGFIELLMTGREPVGPGRRALPRDPRPRGRFIEDPFEEPSPAFEPDPLEEPRGRPRVQRPASVEDGIVRVVDPRFRRQVVAYDGPHRPGTIVIDTPAKYLYLVQPGGRAIRYGIGVGRPGFEWAGMKAVTRKAEWPSWTPPVEMLKRRPDLPRHMVGGPANPLGARALYLGSSLYRIHGTNEPHTIGHAVSSGCIRMMNEDVIDLYNRVTVGTKVLVI